MTIQKVAVIVVVASAFLLGLGAPQAHAGCAACSNWGGYCVECPDDLQCSDVYETAQCYCRQYAEGCIAWSFCNYAPCSWADGGRMDCPLHPIHSIALPKHRNNSRSTPPKPDTARIPRA